jgi:ABC-2 type transport system ATP-binding protein
LSSGQKTRVSLGKAVINDPEILFLDEPTASLDPDTADRVRTFFEKFCKKHNTAIILASHNMEEVTRLCDNVIMMKDGKITDQGSPNSLLKKYGKKKLEDVFLKIARDKNN